MKIELEEALIKDFPLLYPIIFSFEMHDGWEPLVRNLSEKIEFLIKELPEDERSFYRASYVKEKFGTLRFMFHGTDEMHRVIDSFEEESSKICEKCGSPGKLTITRGVWKTRCHDKN